MMCPASRSAGRWRRRLVVAVVVLLLLAAAYVARAPLLRGAGSFLDVSEPPEHADYVMVLGGAAETRPFAAAALHQAGLADRVLVATIKPSPAAEDALVPPEHEVIRQVLIKRGVPAEAIVVLPGNCNSTAEEAWVLAEFLDSEPQATVSVLTTTHHTRRARWIFHRVLGERASQLRFVAAPADGFNGDNWWHFEAGWLAYPSEYFKLAFYLMRY